MAQLTGQGPIGHHADTSTVDTSAKVAVGTRVRDVSGNEYIYLQGVASTVAGSAVTFDEAGVTTLLAANAIGPVAIAQAATVANTFGWYGIFGTFTADGVANIADNALLGRETTDGKLGDGEATGDQILGMISRSATTGAGPVTVQCWYPHVNDATGA